MVCIMRHAADISGESHIPLRLTETGVILNCGKDSIDRKNPRLAELGGD